MGSNRPHGSSRGSAQAAGRHGTPFRAHARRPVRIRSLVTHVQSGWQHQAEVENIGLGGARVIIDEAISVGDMVTLAFAAPSLWDPLVLRARVAWVAAGGPPGALAAAQPSVSRAVGLAFDHAATDAVFALYELIVSLGYE